jgi:hypothetical protein
MRTTLRLIASIRAAVVTVYVVAVALSLTELTRAAWLFYRYLDVFGLAPRVAHLFDWPGYSEDDEFFGPHGALIAYLVWLGVWTILFGALYFRFVFRRRVAI